jgi:tetratricopeptide (TPR) repeat protein
MNTNTRKQTKQVIRAIQSGALGKLGLTAKELAALKNHRGISALHFAAEYQCLDQIKDGATAEQLSEAVLPDGASALLSAAHSGCLHQVEGGVTAAQLKTQKDTDGFSGLMYAAQDGYLHQIHGDITAADLAAERLSDHTSALMHAAFHSQLYLLQGGVTADELAAARADDGNSALHAAASSRSLDQIKGGVTFAQMTASKDGQGRTPLYWAAREGSLNQIKGGVTMAQMKATLCDDKHSAWDIACEKQNDDQIPDAEAAGMLANLRKDRDDFLSVIRMCCEDATHEIKNGNKKVGERLLIKAAIDGSWSGEACGMIADTYRLLDNWKEAFKFAVKAVERAPKASRAWLILGLSCLALNKNQRVVTALEQCLRLDPRCAPAMSMLASVRCELGHPAAEVEALARKAVKTDPAFLTGWSWLAAFLEAIGKHEESEQAHAEYCKRKLRQDAPPTDTAKIKSSGTLIGRAWCALKTKLGPQLEAPVPN